MLVRVNQCRAIGTVPRIHSVATVDCSTVQTLWPQQITLLCYGGVALDQ